MIDLEACARSLVAPGKGLLAADERSSTIDARLSASGITPSAEMRRAYREIFLTAPGIEEFLSGVSLSADMISEKGSDGVPFATALHERDIVVGIKAHEGYDPMPESPKEEVTKGLIGLPERLMEYRRTFHTGFASWRAPIHIHGDTLPTALCIVENAKRLAMYARYVQEAGMVPVMEFDVSREGSHSRMRAKAVLEDALTALMRALADQSVDLSGVIIELSVVLSGDASGHVDAPDHIANDTLDVLQKVVPRNLLGLVFFSRGMTPDQDTDILRALVQEGKRRNVPWPLSFCSAHMLEEEARAIWAGKEEHMAAAQEAFLARLKKVSEAARGA